MATKIEVRGIMSYPHLFVPRAVQAGDDPKYSVNCLIRKDDPQVAVINQAIQTEIANTFPQGWPANGKLCLKDNDEYPEYYELRSNTGAENAPHIVQLPAVTPVQDRSKVYAGAEAWFVLNISAYNQTVNKGVGCYLNGVALTGAEGALGRLDNKPSAEQMFAHLGGGAAAPVMPGMAPVMPVAAPVMPVAAPVAPVMPVAPPVAPVHQMTAAAGGCSYEQMIAANWTDETLLSHGMMLPPGGVPTAFN